MQKGKLRLTSWFWVGLLSEIIQWLLSLHAMCVTVRLPHYVLTAECLSSLLLP